MKGEAQNFNWFKDKLFEIPFFQRPYVWKEDNWDELWNNISVNSSNEMPFIGSFILQTKDTKGSSKYIVIDGQQRLTTLSILIKAFLDSSTDLKADEEYSDAINEIESYIKYKEVKAMKTTKHSRLTPSSIDKFDFLNVMNGISIDSITEDSHNILRCYRYFMDKLSICDKDLRLAIGTKFRSDTKFFIAIELDPNDDEQKIFDSVNRLGMKLLNSDIIKNNLYQRLKEISNNEIDVNDIYNKNWKDVYQTNDAIRSYWEKEITIGRNKGNQLDEFLKDYATIKGLYVASQTGIDGLAKSFKDYTSTLNLRDLISFIEEITLYAEIYIDLFNRKIEDICFDKYDNLNVLLLTLKVTKTSTFNPYLLKLIHDKPSNLDTLLFNLEKFIIKRLIYNASAKNYNKICEQLLKTPDSIDYLENYSDESIDYSMYPTGLSRISNDNAKLLLLIIELIKRKCAGDGKFATLAKYSSFQLEHILPKKWKKHWSDVPCYNSDGTLVEDSDLINLIRESKKFSIGNMTLLKDKLNGSISNSAFETKIKGNGGFKPKDQGIELYVGGLLVAKEIVDSYNVTPEWSEKQIYSRDRELFDTLNNFFNFVTDAKNVIVSPIKSPSVDKKTKIDVNVNDESTWSTVSYRQLAFELIKDLIINEYLSKNELEALSTLSYTKTIVKDIKNALLAFPLEIEEHEWKRERYSRKSIDYGDIKIYVSNQFSKDSLDDLIAWYKEKKK